MRITKKEFDENNVVFEKILNCNFSSATNVLLPFLPIQFNEEDEVDELGMKKKTYKADNFYGNSLMLGLSSEYGEIKPAYMRTTNAFTFDICKLAVLNDLTLTKEELELVSKYEWCLVEAEHLFILDDSGVGAENAQADLEVFYE